MRTLRSPALVELCKQFADNPESLEQLDDARLYHHITLAASLQHSRDEFSPQIVPALEHLVEIVLARMGSGWFNRPSPSNPQARFSRTDALGTAQILRSRLGSLISEKPQGGLWTSSYLPNGESAWGRMERTEFRDEGRKHWSFHFDEHECSIYNIDSIGDFMRLADRYPGEAENRRVCIEWQDVAMDFHAVHLTARGLLTAQNFPVTTSLGVAELRGWDAESTVWLRIPPSARLTQAND